ncbi:probable ATP-dependent RNA helicase DDX31 [Haliotis rubra]|uniref:probable ATP-dependent RNA helicase DDX31 n=1 Tax=Haliotis rubra TaxID=36100 RepID=UPI001EE61046|nr:probable ATP-dependent RNA helicase DDX31 [Haliotis rubra]
MLGSCVCFCGGIREYTLSVSMECFCFSSKVTELKEDVFSSDSFSHLSLHPFMVNVLEERLQLTQMTAVQQRAIPTILQGQDALIKSQTGSGKTLAFAVPIIQKLQALEPPITRADGPYAIVVVPTRELAQQCLQVFINPNSHTVSPGIDSIVYPLWLVVPP